MAKGNNGHGHQECGCIRAKKTWILAHWVIEGDDVVDDLFNQFKQQQMIDKINENVKMASRQRIC